MADIIAGIAPQTDTYANWVSANPTLGKDSGGKSFSQFVFATGSPVGDILIWGNDETFTTAYAAGQYIVMGAEPNSGIISKFSGTWSSTSTWTTGASITINHALNTSFDNLFGFIFLRQDSAPNKIYNATDMEVDAAGVSGQRLNGIDADLNNCFLQIGSRAGNFGRYLNDSGNTIQVPTSGWTYKVVMYKLS